MNFKKKYLRRPKNLKVIDDLTRLGETQNETRLKTAFKNNYRYHGNPLPGNINRVIIKNHSLLRWNERVGPKVKRWQLDLLFTQLLQVPYRITTLSKEIAVIDDDIIFIYKIEGDCLIVLTIYGRLSLKPSLQDLEKLKSYNYRHYDRLSLSIPEHILEEQILPYLPKQLFYFQGTRNFYRIEVFEALEKEMIYVSTFFNGQQKISLINMDVPKQSMINKKVLYVLWQLGYEDFVLQHFAHHYPDKYEEYMTQKNQKALEHQHLMEEQAEKKNEVISIVS